MSETTNAEVLSRILGKLPSVPWASRFDPATMKTEWIYMSPQMPGLYGLSEAELRSDTRSMMARVHPDAGGSAGLATRVNAARDTLLAELKRRS